MNSHGVSSSGQQANGHSPVGLRRQQNSRFSVTLNEVKNRLGKPLGSMNLDELIKNVWSAEANPSNASPASSLQPQASLSLARAFNGKTVEEVWKDILGHKIRNAEETSGKEIDPTLGETTLEDFLVKACFYMADASLGPVTGLQNETSPMGSSPSPSPSVDALSDTSMPQRRRESGDPQKSLDRSLKRKIKSRESAARSRARKQAYHYELLNMVSYLEEANAMLKEVKDFMKMFPSNLSEPRRQLRRTSSV